MRRKRWTKGPWIVNGNAIQQDRQEFKKSSVIAYLEAEHTQETDANAHLLAAAPDLFDALENFTDSFSDNGEFNTYTSEHSVGDLLALAKRALQLAKGAPHR